MTSGGTSQQTRAPRPAGRRPAGSPYTTGSMLRGATAMGVTAAVALVVVATVALGSATGQRLDRRAMDALSSPLRTTHRLVEVLSLVSVWSVALVLAACVVLAVLRRRVAAAVAAMVLVAGANLTTQVLKYDVLTRPDIGFGSTNSLPSGHTTVAVSLALAGVLVAPAALRSLVALLGSGWRHPHRGGHGRRPVAPSRRRRGRGGRVPPVGGARARRPRPAPAGRRPRRVGVRRCPT